LTNAYIESLILYAVLFLRGPIVQSLAGEAVAFSASVELVRIVLYNIPSLALVWYLLFQVKGPRKWGIRRPGRRDILPGFLALPALALIGFTVSLVSPHFSGVPAAPQFLPPDNWPSWVVLVLSCISTGYLEESFFRFYLLSKRDALGLGTGRAALISVLLFSVCHIYEGPWGFLNAVLSGTLLAFIFLRYRSLHGIALAHGLYNTLVYALSGL
jgi:membrane protease YdiL (CAAX protease family)